jgi:hypothetical protein
MAIVCTVLGALAMMGAVFALNYRASARHWYDECGRMGKLWTDQHGRWLAASSDAWDALQERDAALVECERLRREVEELRARLAMGESR